MASLNPTPTPAGVDVQVNTYADGVQQQPAVTALSDGGFVVTWQSLDEDRSSWGIFARRYNYGGEGIGEPFRVNTSTTGAQSMASVTALSDGGFVVAWSSADAQVYGQRFGSDGAAVGAEFRINSSITGNHSSVTVSGFADGGFLAAWAANGQGGSLYEIYGQRYKADGAALGGEFRINSYTQGNQIQPALATMADGGLVVTWSSIGQDGSGFGVYGQRFASDGVPVGTEFRINTRTVGNQAYSSPAALLDGGFVVTWTSVDQDGSKEGIYGQRYGANGAAIGAEFRINTYTNDTQVYSSVTALPDGGFVVSWSSNGQDGSGYGIFGQRFTADAKPAGGEFRINRTTAGDQVAEILSGSETLATLASGRLVQVWSGLVGPEEVFFRLIDVPAPAFTSGMTGSIGENAPFPVVAYDADVTADGPITYSLSGVDSSLFAIDRNHGQVRFLAPPNFEAPADKGADNVYDIVVHARDGSYEISRAVAIKVTDESAAAGMTPVPMAGDVQVNTYTAGVQSEAAVTSLSDGGFVVTWTSSGQDGSGDGVYGQRYAEDGTAIGNEFKVNSYTTSDQFRSSVTSLSDGGFVVIWTSRGQDGSSYGVYGQRYAENGLWVGGEFKVNTYTKSEQSYSTVGALPDGGFVVMWMSSGQGPDGLSHIYGQRYAQNGMPAGNEFRVSSSTEGSQGEPAITSLSDGSFLVTWTSSDASSSGVYGQRYGANGSPVGGEFKVNTFTPNVQSNSSATSLLDGGFVVTWSSRLQDGSGFGIYGQRYAQSGSPVGAEFQVNTETGSDQRFSSVTSMPDGGFVVTWTSSGQDGSGFGIYGQRYAADGTSLGGEFRLNQITGGDQGNDSYYGVKHVASLNDGHFVQVWSGTEEVFVRRVKVPWGDDNTAPSITSDGGQGTASLSVAENTKAVTTVVAHDTDYGQRLTYSLAGGADAAAFAIDRASGALSFVAAPDFEAPADANKDNVYEVVVKVSDGAGGTDSQAIGVTVTNVDAALTITSGATGTVAENAPIATVAYRAAAKDAGENSGTLTYSLASGGDSKLFNIDAGTGWVTLKAPADFEKPGDADGNNIYEITVQASNGSLAASQAVSIKVTDQNDVAPVITTEAALSAAENTKPIVVLTSTDSDTVGVNSPLFPFYSISGGADGALFEISDGSLEFAPGRDYETEAHSYQVEVTVSDGVNESAKLLTIALTDQNDTAPEITTEQDLSVAENTLVVAALTSTDADTVGPTPAEFSVSGWPDAALFDVDAGNLVFKKAPDFETGPERYIVEVTASDGVNKTTKVLVVWLTDQNDVAPVITTEAALSVAENTLVVAALTSTDVDTVGTAPAEFSITGGADAGLFEVAGGNLVFKKAPDFETDPHSYQVEVTASDGVNHSAKLLTVTLTDLPADNNTAPSITSGAAGTVAENAPTTTVVYDAEAKDDGGTLTYSLASHGDSKLFDIDAGTGQVTFKAPADFEKPGDADGNNVYEITVQVSDGSLAASQAVSIKVTDQNDVAPVITTEAALSVVENTLVVAALTSTDVDTVGTAPAEFSITGGADAGLFGIAGSNLVFKKAPDFETDPHSYQVEVTASDGVNHSVKSLTITLTDQNDTAPVITTEATLSVVENTLVVAALTSTDADTEGTAPAEFSITGGTDAGLFEIAGGDLVFKKAPDFETDPHSYQVEVTASDGVNHSAKLLTVTLTDLLADNNTAPTITSDGGQGTASLSVAENTKVVTTVVADDTDYGQKLTYSLAGGADAAAFAIDGASGALSFVTAPDFEAPGDANKDNVYEVVVKVSDGAGGSDRLAIGVTVTDVNTAPTITSGAVGTVAENAPVATVVYDAAAKDDGENSGTLTYSLASGSDSQLFDIDAGTGQVTFKAPADFEKPGDADGNNVYEITMQASDGSLAASQAVSITVTDQNDVAPVITTGATLSVAENTLVVAALTSTDLDTVGTAPAEFSISGGADAALFDVAAGSLVFRKAPDFETDPHSYQVEVAASDGVNKSAKLLTVTLTDLPADNNTAPSITSNGGQGTASLSVAENTTSVTTVVADDTDYGQKLTYSLAGGADAAAFAIDGASGALSFVAAPDFEAPGDANKDNVYEVVVKVSDGAGGSDSQAIGVTVTDVNTSPTTTSGATATVAENAPIATVVYDAAAKDDGENHGTLTYSLAPDGDSNLFDIDAGTGQVTFTAPADFEKPGDADGNNVYEITVQVSDGSLAASQAVSIKVTDQNDVAPVITTEAALSVAENTLVVAALTSTDVDTVGPAPAVFSISGGADAALFGAAGANLVFKKAPDFETDPHSYQVEVTASDGVNHSAKLLTITLTNQNDNAPAITTEAALSIAENTLVVATLTSTDVDTMGTAPAEFSVTGGADAALFDVAGGNLVFKKVADFEIDRHSYQVEVTASDGVNHSAKLLTIALTDQNDVAPVITTEGVLSVAENTRVVAALTSTDADTVGTAPSEFSISGGADAVLFDIAGGNLVFKKAPDFETDPHSYQVEVTASDGVNKSAKLLTVTLTDLLADNNAAPMITSDGGQRTASLAVAENTTAVTTVVAHDTDDGQTLTYSLAGGADAAAFAIDGTSGVLSFAAAPDFETPADANKDNVYEVVVKVSDGAGGTGSQAIGITVTNVNTAPTITSGAVGTVAENAPVATVVYDAAAKDDGEDSGKLTYSLAAGGDSQLFDIDAGTGQVTFKAPADFEAPGDADGNNVYEITVQANDGSLAASQPVSIRVTDQNDGAGVGEPYDHLGALKDVYIVLESAEQLSIDTRSGVLFNDQKMSAGTASLVAGPGHGSVELNADGSFIYSLSENFGNMDTFSYKATSTGGAIDYAEARFYVVPVIVGPSTTTLDLFSLSREEQLAATYVSFLGRGADREGFDFWVEQYVAHGTTADSAHPLPGISSSFGVSEEAKGVYSFLANPHGASDAQIVSFLDSVYLNLFNRTTDEAGRAYWSDAIKETLAAGGSVGSVMMNIVGGAQNTAAGLDITTLMSKVAVNLEYVQAQREVGIPWTAVDDRAQAVALLDPVGSDPQSVLIGVVSAYNIVAADTF